jgi:hypothetical protein
MKKFLILAAFAAFTIASKAQSVSPKSETLVSTPSTEVLSGNPEDEKPAKAETKKEKKSCCADKKSAAKSCDKKEEKKACCGGKKKDKSCDKDKKDANEKVEETK